MENEKKLDGGSFISFVLLDSCEWDKVQFAKDLKEEWGIEVGLDDNKEALVDDVHGMMVAVSLMPAPVPNKEAEHNAATNYLWKEAVETTEKHVAHLMVAVLPKDSSFLDAGQLLVKLCDTALKSNNAIGVFTAGTVFEPSFYRGVASLMHEGELPFFNWVYFGLRQSEEGLMSGYTYGLYAFGKDEIEVVDTTAAPLDLRNFLFNIASYIISADVTLLDGETIGFTAEEKLPISRTEGFNLDGMTLKIEFMPGK